MNSITTCPGCYTKMGPHNPVLQTLIDTPAHEATSWMNSPLPESNKEKQTGFEFLQEHGWFQKIKTETNNKSPAFKYWKCHYITSCYLVKESYSLFRTYSNNKMEIHNVAPKSKQKH
uniref:Uncharacterized protein n=1 Tax=Anguilla anguilla TaxID=7936 RepID=A0A0E9QZX5_ANGAN